MGVTVDETGGNDCSFCVDQLESITIGFSDRNDPTLFNAYISSEPRFATAVNNHGVDDLEVVVHGRSHKSMGTSVAPVPRLGS
jgi:hypothetical protein